MLKVAGKEVFFSKSFMVEPGEEAVLAPVELKGASIRFSAANKGETSGPESKPHVGAEAQLSVPYLENGGSFSSGLTDMATTPEGKIIGRYAGQRVGSFTMVQIELYLERTPNYAQK